MKGFSVPSHGKWIGVVLLLVLFVVSLLSWWGKETLTVDLADLPPASKALVLDVHSSWKASLAQGLNRESSNQLVTEVARKHFPTGSPFEQSEKVLTDAGFRLNKDPFHIPPRNGERHEKTLGILQFSRTYGGPVAVYIFLTPKAPGDFSEVSEATASFQTFN